MNPLDSDHFSSAMTQYQQRLAAAVAAAPAGEGRAQLQALLDQMQQMQGQATDAVQGLQQRADAAMQGLHERFAAVQEKMAAATARRAQILAEVAARKTTRKTPAPLDPHLGQRLTDDLLREFGNRAEPTPVAPPATGSREVWQDWPKG